ncbi:MAG: 5-(carboxyamino)imidazole ribonucleotide mutase [Lachnospiraceae bacterium]|nr:5-(carboxyamino)imidazole ribonucleotide mutase [Lachnospiraceae bacterium]
MAKVAMVMGSDSDMEVMSKAASVLDEFGVEYEMNIISAHREPDVFVKWAEGLEERGIKIVIAGAGMAAHLPGMSAALFPLPVIGVPLKSKALSGEDALYSIVQMPPGIPVATMAIDGGKNAGIMAVKMLAIEDGELLSKLKDFSRKQKEEVMAKDKRLKDIGYKEYLSRK